MDTGLSCKIESPFSMVIDETFLFTKEGTELKVFKNAPQIDNGLLQYISWIYKYYPIQKLITTD